jgi:lipopolysaccharide transport system ATP-binding protein
MSNTAIKVQGLGKRYRIGVRRKRHASVREAILQTAAAPWHNMQRLRRLSTFKDEAATDVVWALRDLDLEVKHGEALGIIGRNGAGKSTLLKILSRITQPSAGRVEVEGRVGALLEVGTGFHPELTGRDNIYLNGAILGMDKAYIDRRFEEIVAFAGVEKFVDTPVKRYSSGMHLRLGFAVAAHLEPEVLIVDEVLAVGDADFRKKSFGKMDEVVQDGRTVLLVSHDMSAIQHLCPRSILLESGRVTADGETGKIVGAYLSAGTYQATPAKWNDLSALERQTTGSAVFKQVRFSSGNPVGGFHPYPDGPMEVELQIDSERDRIVNSLSLSLKDRKGARLISAHSADISQTVHLKAGPNRVRFHIESLHLMPGNYYLGLWLADHSEVLDYLPTAVQIEVLPFAGEGDKFIPSNGAVTCRYTLEQQGLS